MSKFEIITDLAAQLEQREKSLTLKIQLMQAQLDEVRNNRLDLIGAIGRQEKFDADKAAKDAIKASGIPVQT